MTVVFEIFTADGGSKKFEINISELEAGQCYGKMGERLIEKIKERTQLKKKDQIVINQIDGIDVTEVPVKEIGYFIRVHSRELKSMVKGLQNALSETYDFDTGEYKTKDRFLIDIIEDMCIELEKTIEPIASLGSLRRYRKDDSKEPLEIPNICFIIEKYMEILK